MVRNLMALAIFLTLLALGLFWTGAFEDDAATIDESRDPTERLPHAAPAPRRHPSTESPPAETRPRAPKHEPAVDLGDVLPRPKIRHPGVETFIVGQFVDELGRPMDDDAITYRLEIIQQGGSGRSSGSFSHPRGQFRVPLRNPALADGVTLRSLWFKLAGSDGDPDRGARVDLTRDFPPGDTNVGNVALEPFPVLATGFVVDDTGSPRPDARVSARMNSYASSLWGSVDDNADFVIRGLAEAHHVKLMAWLDGVWGPVTKVPVGSAGVRLLVPRPSRVHGQIVLSERTAPASILIGLHPEERDSKGGSGYRDDGFFEFRGRPPGRYRLVVSDQGKRPIHAIRDIDVRYGADINLGEIPIDFVDHTYRITVRDAEGRNLKAWVQALAAESGKVLDSEQTRDGQALFHLPESVVDIHIRKDGYTDAFVGAATDHEVVTLVRQETCRVSLRAHGIESLLPSEGVQVMVQRRHHSRGKTFDSRVSEGRKFLDAQGRASIELPGPGTYTIRYWATIESRTDSKYESGSISFEFKAGPTEFVVRSGGDLVVPIEIDRNLVNERIERLRLLRKRRAVASEER